MKKTTLDLDGINTSKFYFDIKKTDFIKESFKYPEFDMKGLEKIRENLIIYIVLLYDKHSPIRQDIESPFAQKKKEAATLAGLSNGGRVSSEIADILIGEHDGFNMAFTKYLTFQHNFQLQKVAILELTQEKAMMNAMKDGSQKSLQLVMDVTNQLEEAINKLTGGEEIPKMKAAIQAEAGKLNEGIRPEDYVEREKTGDIESPYGGSYRPDDIKFLSHRKPE
jgi:hypothetical protein